MTDIMVSEAMNTAGYVFPKPGPQINYIEVAIINYKSLLITDVDPFKLTLETMNLTEYNKRSAYNKRSVETYQPNSSEQKENEGNDQ